MADKVPESPKIRVFKDFEITIDGLTPVWVWLCKDKHCQNNTIDFGHALFWENAMRGAHHHLVYHKGRAAAAHD